MCEVTARDSHLIFFYSYKSQQHKHKLFHFITYFPIGDISDYKFDQ